MLHLKEDFRLRAVISSVKLAGDGSDVTQNSMIWKKQDEYATINCNHTKDYTYSQMYWYRQLPGETMKLVVFTSTAKPDHDFGNFSREKFAATKPDAYTGTFTVKDLEPKDKGLYFCAVSKHSDTDAPSI
uniref:Ig-like domain-containing protein n=2 Tax=Haplochromini TaxID=319058 RepID=A0A3P9BZW5_9CICH